LSGCFSVVRLLGQTKRIVGKISFSVSIYPLPHPLLFYSRDRFNGKLRPRIYLLYVVRTKKQSNSSRSKCFWTETECFLGFSSDTFRVYLCVRLYACLCACQLWVSCAWERERALIGGRRWEAVQLTADVGIRSKLIYRLAGFLKCLDGFSSHEGVFVFYRL